MFCEVSLEWERFSVLVEDIPGFVEVSPREGSRKFEKKNCRTGYFVNSPENGFDNLVVLKYWLVSGIPPGLGFDFVFAKVICEIWNGGLEIIIKYMWKILTSRCMYRKICGLGFELFLKGKCCWSNGWKFMLFRKGPQGYFNSSLEISKKLVLCCRARTK